MVIESKPERRRLTAPGGTAVPVDEGLLTVEHVERPPAGPPPPARPTAAGGGPTWRQFLIVQLVLALAVSGAFGSIAYATIARQPAAPPAAAASGADALATMPGMPGMSATPAAAAATTSAPRLPQPQLAPPIGQRGPTTVQVTLSVQEVVATLADGVTYDYWTFDGTVPGPMIRAKQGDTVEVTLTNPATNKASHSIDLHAVSGPGGGMDASMVAPGQSKTFRFKALHPGVFVYHCATAPVQMHIASGMYGLIVIEPPQGLPKVDREFYVMQGEFYLTGASADQGLRTYSQAKMLAEQPDYVVFNGAVGALTGDNALQAKTGETVRIFFGVGGPNLTSSFHVIGQIFDRVAVEGASLEDPAKWGTNVQTTLVPAGGATVVEFTTPVPGTYTLVDHSLGRTTKGAAAQLVVAGPDNPDVFAPGR
ncbi:MAG TPA: copper-containing nitrite reductase [Thermomicrobiales bacterium]|nr:copper-containing nitrite reductase [Thermomicrobiales bacterium]